MNQTSAADLVSASHGIGRTLGVPGGVSVLVTRTPDEHGTLRCGDDVLKPQRPPACSAAPAESTTIRPGTRFIDPASGLEVVCTRAGHGTLTFNGRLMQPRYWPDHQATSWARRQDSAA